MKQITFALWAAESWGDPPTSTRGHTPRSASTVSYPRHVFFVVSDSRNGPSTPPNTASTRG